MVCLGMWSLQLRLIERDVEVDSSAQATRRQQQPSVLQPNGTCNQAISFRNRRVTSCQKDGSELLRGLDLSSADAVRSSRSKRSESVD